MLVTNEATDASHIYQEKHLTRTESRAEAFRTRRHKLLEVVRGRATMDRERTWRALNVSETEASVAIPILEAADSTNLMNAASLGPPPRRPTRIRRRAAALHGLRLIR